MLTAFSKHLTMSSHITKDSAKVQRLDVTYTASLLTDVVKSGYCCDIQHVLNK